MTGTPSLVTQLAGSQDFGLALIRPPMVILNQANPEPPIASSAASRLRGPFRGSLEGEGQGPCHRRGRADRAPNTLGRGDLR